jgi:hypothetical protein
LANSTESSSSKPIEYGTDITDSATACCRNKLTTTKKENVDKNLFIIIYLPYSKLKLRLMFLKKTKERAKVAKK